MSDEKHLYAKEQQRWSAYRKQLFSDLNNLLGFADLSQMWHFADLRILDPFLWFADFKLPQVRKYRLFSHYKSSIYVKLKIKILHNKKSFKRQLLGLFRDKVVQYFEEICGFTVCWLIEKNCGFAICGPAHLRNLRVCDSRMCPRIFGFAICLPTSPKRQSVH